MASDRPSSRFENKDGSGVIQGTISPEDRDTNGGADTERTERTPVVKRAARWLPANQGKHRKK